MKRAFSPYKSFSGKCLVSGPMLSRTMEAQVRPGEQTFCLSPMKGREDHPGRGNGIAKTQRRKQHWNVSWKWVENEAVILGCAPICTLFCWP